MKIQKYNVSRRAILISIVGVGGAALVGGATGFIPLGAERAPTRGDVTLYKNPQCDCCASYANYPHHNGFNVKTVLTNYLTFMGEKYDIPDSLQSCHILLIGGYVVVGHIPIEVVNRLLKEKPQITGITLPGMPQGTPGMPGKKSGP